MPGRKAPAPGRIWGSPGRNIQPSARTSDGAPDLVASGRAVIAGSAEDEPPRRPMRDLHRVFAGNPFELQELNPWPTPRRRTAARRPSTRPQCRRSTRLRNTARTSRSRTRTRRARSQPQQQGPQINIQVNVNAKQLAETDFEVDLTLEGDAQDRHRGAVRLRAHLFGRVPRPNMPAGPAPSGGDDRVPAPAVPVRAADRGRCGAQRRLPAALHRPDRFRGLYRQKATEQGAGRRPAVGARRPPAEPRRRGRPPVRGPQMRSRPGVPAILPMTT